MIRTRIDEFFGGKNLFLVWKNKIDGIFVTSKHTYVILATISKNTCLQWNRDLFSLIFDLGTYICFLPLTFDSCEVEIYSDMLFAERPGQENVFGATIGE